MIPQVNETIEQKFVELYQYISNEGENSLQSTSTQSVDNTEATDNP